MVIRNKFLWKKEIMNLNFSQKESHIEKKVRAYEFYDKGKVDVMDFWVQKKPFSTQKVGRIFCSHDFHHQTFCHMY